jgi:hypothetical protein
METNTQFDLNQAIQRWREGLEHLSALESASVNELETHLRDSTAALEQQGLSEEEAFLIAMKRMGRPDALVAEYAKGKENLVWLERGLWILVGIQFTLVATDLTHIVSASLFGMWRSPIFIVLLSFLTMGVPVVGAWKALRSPHSRWRARAQEAINKPVLLAAGFLLFGLLLRTVGTLLTWLAYQSASQVMAQPGIKVVSNSYPIITNILVQMPFYAFSAALIYFLGRKRLRLLEG